LFSANQRIEDQIVVDVVSQKLPRPADLPHQRDQLLCVEHMIQTPSLPQL
jgi:hypothetical protein